MASSGGSQYRQINLAPPTRHAVQPVQYRTTNPMYIGQRMVIPRQQMPNTPQFASQHSVASNMNTPYHQAVPVYQQHPMHPSPASNSIPRTKYHSKKLKPEYIRTKIAETIGIENISEESCAYLIQELDSKLRQILQTASKYTRHSCTTKLTSSQVNSAIKFHEGKKLYGYTNLTNQNTPAMMARCTEKRGSGEPKGANSQSRLNIGPNGQSISQNSSAGNISPKNNPTSKHHNNFTSIEDTRKRQKIHVLEDTEIDLEEFIEKGAGEVKLPLDVTLKSHWLFVDGVQPSIPENPIPKITKPSFQSSQLTDGRRVLNMDGSAVSPSLHKFDVPIQQGLKPVVKHDLSLEQQLFYKEITESIIGVKEKSVQHGAEDKKVRDEALASLRYATGIHQLLPRFIAFFHEGIKCNVANFSATSDRSTAITYYTVTGFLLKMMDNLNQNVNISLEDYIHEILPGLFTCCLSNKLASPHYKNQFRSRDLSATIISSIVNCYSSSANGLEVRVACQSEIAIRNSSSNIHSLFGSVMVLIKLGEKTMEHYIHLLKTVFEKTRKQLVNQNHANQPINQNNNQQNMSPETMTAKEMDKLLFSGFASSDSVSVGDDQLLENLLLPILAKINHTGRLARCGNSSEDFDDFFGETFGAFLYKVLNGSGLFGRSEMEY